MAGILPFGFDEQTGVCLSGLLYARGHRVYVCASTESFLSTLHLRGKQIDLLVLYLSAANRYCSSELAAVNNYRGMYDPKPMLLCVLDMYRGTRFELELEQKGARVAYVPRYPFHSH